MPFNIPSAEELLHRFTYYDYAIFLCMVGSSGVLGLYCAFNEGPQNTIRQLLTADGKLPSLLVSTSLMASFISASYILGNTSEIYQHGTMYVFTALSYCLVIPITAHLYMPVFYRSEVLTCYEYLELRFNRLVRYIALGFYIIQMLIYVAIQLYAPALALSYVTGMGLWTAVLTIGLICTAYTSVGGIKAVVYTDSLQAMFMFAALTVVVVLGFQSVGGFMAAWSIAHEGGRIRFDDTSLDPTVRHTFWGMIFGSFFSNLASYATNQMMVLRYFTVSSLTRAKCVVWGNLFYLTWILTLSCLCGLMVYAYFHACDPLESKQIQSYDELLPYFVMVKLGHITGLPGVFVAGIFAASLSSISSAVNALSNVLYVDIISLIQPNLSNKAGSRIINLLGIVVGFLSVVLVAVAQTMGNVQAATNAINSSVGGPLLGLFTTGMFVPFVNSKGVLTGFAVALSISLWLSIVGFLYPAKIIRSPPPISVDACRNTYMRVTNSSSYFPPTPKPWAPGEGYIIAYRLSYVWNAALSVFIVLVVSIVTSLLTNPQDPRTLNPNLIGRPFDVLCPWISKKILDSLAFNVGEDYEIANKLKVRSIPDTSGNDNSAHVGCVDDP
ncbi:sodium-coupled monocarboxylate transporter 2-like isoform X1 [Varroa jacobsoni]|uniref:sodium-coupled monocarboxylate transporter 2-like isoform X1 n=1 Tax=Varroa jacobsoni TaxID=62625 RepID=UPI000BF39330|nr:sodium-coupled monocarboxylate transporter 2-like isoform X1 [Varroa jacobsoni]XP_022700774.1 sodium-coupled monocarboxylate transporter 2-like isoform X1 [Varroa jacobsoni]